MASSGLQRVPLTTALLVCGVWGCSSESSGDSRGTGGTSSGGIISSGGISSGGISSGGIQGSSGISGSGGVTAGSGGTQSSIGGMPGSSGDAGDARQGGGKGGTGFGGGAGTAGMAETGGASGTSGTTAGNSAGGLVGTTGSDAATLVPDPSWTCGMAEGIPAPSTGKAAFSVSLNVSATHDVGTTQFGKRRQLDISGGTISGDKLKGTVLTGGLDYELTLSNGTMELEEVLVWKTSDNVSIFVRVCGVAAAGDSAVRIVPDIEAPTSGSVAWLNTTKLVGTRKVDSAGSKITLDIYDVSGAAAGGAKIQLNDPAGVPSTTWDCVAGSGARALTCSRKT